MENTIVNSDVEDGKPTHTEDLPFETIEEHKGLTFYKMSILYMQLSQLT